jgi:hypothetical protein
VCVLICLVKFSVLVSCYVRLLTGKFEKSFTAAGTTDFGSL